jgi:hypothetical protein
MNHIEKLYRLLVLLAVVSATSLWGQAVSTLSGTVSDPTGAVIPGASIIIEDVERGLKRETTADNAGRYTFPQVTPGMYRVTAKASGFNDVVINQVQLLVNSPVTVNIQFEKVGQVVETVSVSAEAVQVNTTDASIGNAVATKSITQMPLNARNIVGLLALQPGVVFTSEESTNYRNGAVNGGKSDQANVTLDGVDVNDQMDRYAFTSVLRMTPDAVQEFRVTTMNANADAGRSSGAQVVMLTKSGTNELHGSLYHYHRNTATSANEWFLNATGNERRKLIRNIFGASAGAPIVKNRLFIFGNYEGRRDARDGEAVRDVPSMNMRQGILQYRRADGSIATVTPDQLRQIDPRGVSPAALDIFKSYPVPNDTTRGDGLNLVGYRFKAPTPLRWNTYIARIDYAVDSAGKHTAFLRGNLQNDNEKQLPQFPGLAPNIVKLTNNKGFGTGLTSVLTPALVSNFRYGLTRVGWENSGVLSFPWVEFRGLSPTFGTNRSFAAIIPTHTISEDLNWTKGAHTLQFGGILRKIRNKRTDYQNSFSRGVSNASWLVSSGAELNAPFTDLPSSQYTLWRYAVSNVLGLITQGDAKYNYLVDGTVLPEGGAVLRNFAGDEYEMYIQDTWKATRALTITAGLRYSLAPPIYERNGQQVSPNIPIGDWFNLRGSLAQQGRSQAEAGRISFIPKDNGGRDLYAFHKKNFAPRIAIAYSPQGTDGLSKFFFGGPGRTSIRAGWGMFYDMFGSGLMRSYDSTAFGLSNALTNASATLTAANAPKFTTINQIPSQVLVPAPPAKFPAEYPDIFAITNGLDDTIVPPYNLSMNFSIGREFNGGWFVQGSYVGRLSRRSLIRRDAAMPTDFKEPKSGMTYFEAASILAQQVIAGVPIANVQKVSFWENLYSKAATATQTATQVVYDRFRANQYDWTYALYQLDTGVGQGNCAARPRCSDLGPYTFFNPQFSYLSVFSSIGGGNYHGAQMNVSKRFSNGDSISANYTFSKSIDLRSHTEGIASSTGVLWNPWQPGLQTGVSDYDNTHLFNMLAVYSLPVGTGRRFATDAGGLLNAIIGGWQLAGAWRWSSGFPTSVYATGVWPTNWNNNVWAQWNTTPIKVERTMTPKGPNIFAEPQAAIKAFDYPLPGGIGTRNGVRGDGLFNIDLNLAKRFVMPYSEKHSVQFRWETFNLTNTPSFDVDTISADISVGGTFGQYTTTLSNSRVMQFGLRYEF